MRELIYYVSVSLDGYIAGPNGEFDAFPIEGDHMDRINERFSDAIPTDIAGALGVEQRNDLFDTVLMGWNSYAVGLPMMPSPYRHLRQLVFSRTRTARDVAGELTNLTITADDPLQTVRTLKREPGKAIWLCGGGALASVLSGEIDRLVLKRNPVVFGSGIPLFAPTTYRPVHFDAVETTAFRSGVVFSEYVRRPAGGPGSPAV